MSSATPTDQTPVQPGQAPESGSDPAVTILVVGGSAHALLCLPAIGQRGFPPIDPAWEVIPFLWPLPLLLSALFNRAPDSVRLRSVVIYAVVTAFFVSGTFTFMVPRFVNPAGMLLMTLVGTGPFHIVVAAIIEFLAQTSRRACHWWMAGQPGLRLILKLLIAAAIVLGTVAAPFAWRTRVWASQRELARRTAEDDWNARRALVYRSLKDDRFDYVDDVRIARQFDDATGLLLEQFPKFFGYDEAYNQRIVELLAERGVPKWSMKRHLVRNQDLISMLDSNDVEVVGMFPHKFNDGFTMTIGGRVAKLNGAKIESGGSLELRTIGYSGPWGPGPSSLNIGLEGNEPIYLGRMPAYPEVIFVRLGTHSVYAFHRTGWRLAEASRR